MNKRNLLWAAAALGLAATGVNADDDDHKGWGFLGAWWKPERHSVAPVSNETYATECGACHFAYPPALLPARSWERLMTTLDDHFGENAELLPDTAQTISDYLQTHAADRSEGRLAHRLAKGVRSGMVPLRISELPYIRHEHDEIPRRYITGNPDVRSLSHCNACHIRADRGDFTEEAVQVPGLGHWDDD